MIFPIDTTYQITNHFRSDHLGIDIAPTPAGRTDAYALAPENGIVRYSSVGNVEGNYIIMKGDSGNYYYFGHFAERLVNAGEAVTEGQALGVIGMTGSATGIHTHHEVRVGQATPGTQIDPEEYYKNNIGDAVETFKDTNDVRVNGYGLFGIEVAGNSDALKNWVGKPKLDFFKGLGAQVINNTNALNKRISELEGQAGANYVPVDQLYVKKG